MNLGQEGEAVPEERSHSRKRFGPTSTMADSTMSSQVSMRNVPVEYMQDPPSFLQFLNEFLWSIGLWDQIPRDAEEDAEFPVTDVQRIDHDGGVLSWMLVKCRSSGISDLLLNYSSDLSIELGQTVTVTSNVGIEVGVKETMGGPPHKISRFMVQWDTDPSIIPSQNLRQDGRPVQALAPHQSFPEDQWRTSAIGGFEHLAGGLPHYFGRSMDTIEHACPRFSRGYLERSPLVVEEGYARRNAFLAERPVPQKSHGDKDGPALDAALSWQVPAKVLPRHGQKSQSIVVAKGPMVVPQLQLLPPPPGFPASCAGANSELLLQPTQESVPRIEHSSMIQVAKTLHELASNAGTAGWPVARGAMLQFVDHVPFEIEALYFCASASPALRNKTIDLIVSLLHRDANVVEQTIQGSAMPSIGPHSDVTYGKDNHSTSPVDADPVATNGVIQPPSSPSDQQHALEKGSGVPVRSSKWRHYNVPPAILEKLKDIDSMGGCFFRSTIFQLTPLLGKKASIPSQFSKLCECLESPRFSTLEDPWLTKIRNEGTIREVMYWMLRYLRELNVVELPVEMLELPGSFSSMPNFSYQVHTGWKKGFQKFPRLLFPRHRRLDPDSDKRFANLEWDAFTTNGAMRKRLNEIDRSGGQEIKPFMFLVFQAFLKSKCMPKTVKSATKLMSKLMNSLAKRYILDSLKATIERQRVALLILRYLNCLKIASIEPTCEEWTEQSEVVWRPLALKKFALNMDFILTSDTDRPEPMQLKSSPMQLRNRIQLRSSVAHVERVDEPSQSTDAEPMQREKLRSIATHVDGVHESGLPADAGPKDLTSSPMQLRSRVKGSRDCCQLTEAESKGTHVSSQPTAVEPMLLRSRMQLRSSVSHSAGNCEPRQPTDASPIQLRTRMQLRSRVAQEQRLRESSQPIDTPNPGDFDPRDR